MGIKHVWTILTPFCERKPLYELQGKTVAVDLSCWICEAQNIAEYDVQPRMYLRNLYFRACYLLLLDVSPIFVLEGKAPELKYDTISARNAIQFKGTKPKTDKTKTGKDRTRFNHILKSCEEMLSYIGIPCLKGQGEAESMCAYLNDEGLVDGCISQDSDCFAYGAKTVYRNFSISTQGAYAASGGAVDIYDIQKAYESINFGRNKIVAMALLCGSDYSDGVPGIGKESVLKFFEKLSDEQVFDRIKTWRTKPDLFDELESCISDKDICKSCGHHGKLQAHTKNGCRPCGTTKGCDAFKFKEERLRIKNELNMRNKALQDPNFPDENLINEYLVKKDNVSQLNLKWKQPDLVRFVKFTQKFLQWEEIYSFEKILPVLTRWQCLNYHLLKSDNNVKGIIYPDRIKKVRNPKGVPSFEIIWNDPHNYFKGILNECHLVEGNINLEKLWSTIEPQILVERAYPELVEAFKRSKMKPPKTSKRKKKTVDSKENTSVSEPANKKTRKTKTSKTKNKEEKALEDLHNSFNQINIGEPKRKTTTLDNYLKKAVLNSQKQSSTKLQVGIATDKIVFETNMLQTSTPSKPVENSNSGMSWTSLFNDDDDEADLSDIVEGIVSRKLNFVKDYMNTNNINVFEETPINDEHNSSFFMKIPTENDIFERTFNEITNIETDESTEEYELDKFDNADDFVHDLQAENNSEIHSNLKVSEEEQLYDSFLGRNFDLPLIERLKMKLK